MSSFSRMVVAVVGLLIAASRAEAYPLLQLDIVGGTYDPITQTTISDGPNFTLVALLTPKPTNNLQALLNDTYYISAAIMPKVGPLHSNVGGYTWNGTNYAATSDMTFGTPPIEGLAADYDIGDLNDPNIFPTFFNEFTFQFSANQRAVTYFVPQDAGGFTQTTATTGISYFQTFNITTSLTGDYVLHFNLYDTYIKRCSLSGGCPMDIEIEHFAPLYADAQSSNLGVPEPASFAVVFLGLAFAGVFARRTRLGLVRQRTSI